MNRILRLCASTLTAGVLIVIPPVAFGQPAQRPGAPDLVAVLHLRPDQQAAFHAYQAAGPQPGEMDQLRSSRDLGALTTPERLDRIGAVLKLQLTVFQRKAQATRAFYTALSPEQQHTFDQITAPPPRN